MNEEAHEPELGTSYPALDPDGVLRNAFTNASPHMQAVYDLLKHVHDSNAVANAANAAVLAENSRVLNDTTRALTGLTSRLQDIEQNQHALSARVDAGLAEMRTAIACNTAANKEEIKHRILRDPREIIMRGIPPAVRHDPLPLAAAILRALKLDPYIPFLVSWRT